MLDSSIGSMTASRFAKSTLSENARPDVGKNGPEQSKRLGLNVCDLAKRIRPRTASQSLGETADRQNPRSAPARALGSDLPEADDVGQPPRLMRLAGPGL